MVRGGAGGGGPRRGKVVSRVSLVRYLPYSNTTTAAAMPVWGTRPQTEWEGADKRRSTSLTGFSGGSKELRFLRWCAHGCSVRLAEPLTIDAT